MSAPGDFWGKTSPLPNSLCIDKPSTDSSSDEVSVFSTQSFLLPMARVTHSPPLLCQCVTAVSSVSSALSPSPALKLASRPSGPHMTYSCERLWWVFIHLKPILSCYSTDILSTEHNWCGYIQHISSSMISCSTSTATPVPWQCLPYSP